MAAKRSPAAKAAKKPTTKVTKPATAKAAKKPTTKVTKPATAKAATDPAQILAAYQARRAAFVAARKALDEQAQAQLRRYLTALFREEAGLQVALLGAFQDYDSSRLRGQAYVTDDLEYRWEKVGFEGPCPTNELPGGAGQRIREELMEFWPSVQRLEGYGWFMAFRRDPAAEGGFSAEKRPFYSDD